MSSRLACNIEGKAYEGIDKGYPKPYLRIQFLLIRLLLLWIPPWSFGVWMHSFYPGYFLNAYKHHGLSFTSYLWATCACFLFSSLLPLFPVCFSLFMHVLLPLLVDGLRGAYFPVCKGVPGQRFFWMNVFLQPFERRLLVCRIFLYTVKKSFFLQDITVFIFFSLLPCLLFF